MKAMHLTLDGDFKRFAYIPNWIMHVHVYQNFILFFGSI